MEDYAVVVKLRAPSYWTPYRSGHTVTTDLLPQPLRLSLSAQCNAAQLPQRAQCFEGKLSSGFFLPLFKSDAKVIYKARSLLAFGAFGAASAAHHKHKNAPAL